MNARAAKGDRNPNFISFDCLNLTVLTVKRAWNGFHFSGIFRSWVLSIVPHFTYRVQHCFQVFHNLLSKSGLQSSRQSDWLWKHWNCHRSLKLVANFLLCQSQDGKVKFLQKLLSEKLKLKNSCVNFSIVRFYYNSRYLITGIVLKKMPGPMNGKGLDNAFWKKLFWNIFTKQIFSFITQNSEFFR